MVRTPVQRRGVIATSVFAMFPLAVAACAVGGRSAAAPVPATPVTPAETVEPPTEAEPPAETAEPPAAVGAIFTEAQADRGKTTFDEVCSECHTNSEFRGRSFQSKWGHRTVYSFYRTTRSTMPDDNPGGLEPQVYLDVVSYILSMNGHDAGESELSPDSPMREVRIDPGTGR